MRRFFVRPLLVVSGCIALSSTACTSRVILDEGIMAESGSSGSADDDDFGGEVESDSAGGSSSGVVDSGECVPGQGDCPCPPDTIPDGNTCVPVPSAVQLLAAIPENTEAFAGQSVEVAPQVVLLGPDGPIPGGTITFTSTGETGAILGAASALTDADGMANSLSWELGKLDAEYVVEARSVDYPELAPVVFTAQTISDFQIVLHYTTGATSSQQDVFDRARRRWQGALTNAHPVLEGNLADFAAMCGYNVPGQDVAISGLHIFVELAEIDGPGGPNGNILGQAGPCFLRDDGSPALGGMTFDTFDLDGLEAEGSLETVILHEMGHVLGVGSLWGERGLLRDPSIPNNEGADTHFIGQNATGVFLDLLQSPYEGAVVPVENSAAQGSADGHWRENITDNELMSPRLGGFGRVAPLSLLTISSLLDHGYYDTNNFAADDYALPFFVTAPPGEASGAHPAAEHHIDEIRYPRWQQVDGSVLPYVAAGGTAAVTNR